MREMLVGWTRRVMNVLNPLVRRLSGLMRGRRRSQVDERLEPKAESGRLAAKPKRQALIKDRPISLEQRYQPVDDGRLADSLFRRLQRHVYQSLDGSTTGAGAARRPVVLPHIVLRESGQLAVRAHDEIDETQNLDGRPYFYLKPAGAKGWLFERSGAGWVVARAEKNQSRGLFMRDGAPFDRVTLYMSDEPGSSPRVRSQALGGDLISFAVYEQKVLSALDN